MDLFVLLSRIWERDLMQMTMDDLNIDILDDLNDDPGDFTETSDTWTNSPELTLIPLPSNLRVDQCRHISGYGYRLDLWHPGVYPCSFHTYNNTNLNDLQNDVLVIMCGTFSMIWIDQVSNTEGSRCSCCFFSGLILTQHYKYHITPNCDFGVGLKTHRGSCGELK